MTTTATPLAIPAEPAPRAATRTAFGEDALAESFRLLALNIQRLLQGEAHRSVLVMSAHPEDGRTFAAVRLAQALAELAEPILVLDADPVGSAEVRASQGLHVITPARLAPTTQAEFISSVRDALAFAERQRLTVIVDTPACVRSSIAFHLAAHVGGVLYIARRRRGDLAVHSDVRSQLDLLGARILGLVFNEA